MAVEIPQEEMDKLMSEVGTLSPDEVKAFLNQYSEKVEKRKAYHKAHNMTDEQKESRKQYNAKRRAREKLMLAKAKELGLIGEGSN